MAGDSLKKIVIALILALGLTLSGAAAARAADLEIGAAAAILIDADSGRVLFAREAHQRLPVASLTKIMTALVTLEHYEDLRQTFTLPQDFANVGESALGLEAGETQTIEDLLYALMLRSANDAGQALALAVAGSESDFSSLMNERCLELGLTDSNWLNPHGLHQEAHLSSAYDMAYIARAAMQIPMFNTLIKTSTHTIPWAGQENDRVVTAHNRLLTLYAGADGIKTGYTAKAGNCLAGSATKNGLRLIGVVLNSEDTYGEMAALLDYGFANYEMRQLVAFGDVAARIAVENGRLDSINLVFASNLSLIMPKGEQNLPQPELLLPERLDTPIYSGEPRGEAVFSDGAGNFKRVELVAAGDIERFTLRGLLREAFLSIMRALLV
jgi:D-alanyl-D-alanine carboxypeptidase